MKSHNVTAICEERPTDNITIYNPYPTNGSIDINVGPQCNITVNHSNGKGMTVSWYENNTGSWMLRQTNGSKNWYNSFWKYRKLITINHTKVGTVDLVNFPVLIYRASDSDLGAHAQSNGNDICFVLYSDNTTKLNHEIESYTTATGNLAAWVNITDLSGTTDTKLWMYYGNPSCANQQNKIGTWNGNYKSVYHLSEASGGSGKAIKDSTCNSVNGTNSTSDITYASPGIAGNCFIFGGTSGKVDFGTPAAWDSKNITVEAWVKTTTSASVDRRIVAGANGFTNKWLLTQTYSALRDSAAMSNATDSHATASTNAKINDGTWHYLVGIRNREKMYNNGSLQNGTVTDYWSYSTACIASKGTSNYFAGSIDEIRISNIERNSSWMGATYNTTSNPSAFFSTSNEQTLVYNGTYRWIYTQASTNGTLYYWKVAVNDTYHTVTGVYHFTTTTPNQPPYIPSNPNPTNGSIDVNLNAALVWDGGDPDPGDTVNYSVYFGTSSSPPWVTNQNGTSYDPMLSYSTTYYWKIVAWDNHDASTIGPVWHFTTEADYPPVFGTPSPSNGSTGEPLSFTWSIPINDPEGDLFSWTIQCSNGQTTGGTGASNGTKSLALSGLSYSTMYKVWVNATDPSGSGLYTKKWYVFTTKNQAENPPYVPHNPHPAEGATNVNVSTVLSWTGGDPDPGDTVTYDVYFGTTNPPPKLINNQSSNIYNPATLAYNTTYYWQIIAWDNHGNQAMGPIWNFTTMQGTDVTPPFVAIEYPYRGYINLNYQDIYLNFPFFMTILIGKINVIVKAYDNESGMNRVEFWTDTKLRYTDNESPYNWVWSEKGLYQYTLRVVAYDNAGNHNEDAIMLWKIQFR
ncbi:MAG TPA: DUF2341 domain-containing protein [Candidatus Thermoplasmatota archaeon]|nr:DUF2341 domain-containing protein [Candidatus Thermoplasmatota archaeon]